MLVTKTEAAESVSLQTRTKWKLPKFTAHRYPHPRQEQQLTRPILFRPTLETDRNSLRLMKAVAKWHDRSLLNFPRVWKYKKKEEKVWNESTSHLEPFQNVLRRGSTPPAKHLKPIPIEMAKKGISQSFRKWANPFPQTQEGMKTQIKKKTNKNSKLSWRSSSQAICPASRFWAYFDKQKGNVAKESQKKKKKRVRMALRGPDGMILKGSWPLSK